jgi:hypothetical protein
MLGFETWRGMDTLALHQLTFFGWRETFSAGWGAAEQGRRSSLRGQHGGSPRVNRRTSRLAMRDLRASGGSRGLPAMRDLSRLEAGAANDVRIDLELAVSVAAGPDARRRPMTALASARSFHARPVPRTDRRRELPSLYAPYWQARLATPPWVLAP